MVTRHQAPPAYNTPAIMMLTVALKRSIAQCSSGLQKLLTFAEGFVRSYNYFAVTMLQDRGRAGVVIQYCNIAPGGFGPFTVCSLE